MEHCHRFDFYTTLCKLNVFLLSFCSTLQTFYFFTRLNTQEN